MIRSAGLSSVGKVRQSNQDAYRLDPDHGVFILSDGMGGEQAGDTASTIVVSVFPELIRQRLSPADPLDRHAVKRALRDATAELNQMVLTETRNNTALAGLGATLVALLLRPPRAFVANLGDSRAYRFRSGRLQQLTRDHTLAGLLARSGEIEAEEARHHAGRSMLTRYIGMATDAYPDVRSLALKPQDRLLLCSDGLTGMLSDAQIAEHLRAKTASDAACSALVSAANQAGGVDNVTCVVVDWAGA